MTNNSVITDDQWQEAYEHLQEYIGLYAEIPTGMFALNLTLFPLRARYLNGERTTELHKAMMEVK